MHLPNELNYKVLRKLPAMSMLSETYPVSLQNKSKIHRHRQEIKDILSGKDNRFLVIVGPCSAWPDTAVLSYAKKLKDLNSHLNQYLKIVMRVYIQKPRTIGGWSGPLYQPDPYAPPDILKGMHYTRQMMMQVIDLDLPIADEALYVDNSQGYLELLSWVAIGARSAENPGHRIFASGLTLPVGMKNPTHGNLKICVNSVKSAQTSHIARVGDHEVLTKGNPFAHVVLRGSHAGPNYSKSHLETLQHYLKQQTISHPAIIIDASHDNTLREYNKNYLLQSQNITEILDLLKTNPNLSDVVKGFMIESFIKPGSQNLATSSPLSLDRSGLSITDACLGWDETEHILLALSNHIRDGSNR